MIPSGGCAKKVRVAVVPCTIGCGDGNADISRLGRCCAESEDGRDDVAQVVWTGLCSRDISLL